MQNTEDEGSGGLCSLLACGDSIAGIPNISLRVNEYHLAKNLGTSNSSIIPERFFPVVYTKKIDSKD